MRWHRAKKRVGADDTQLDPMKAPFSYAGGGR